MSELLASIFVRRSMAEHTPHAANVPGDFYVEDGCCTMCEVPFAEAPGLFAVIRDPGASPPADAARQPQTPEERPKMVSATRGAERACTRYRAPDKPTLDPLITAGERAVCDRAPPA